MESTVAERRARSYLFGTGLPAGAGAKEHFFFYLWNFGILLLSAAGICVLTLLLSTGDKGLELFFDYFRHPLIFFLNFLPILLLELFMYCLIGRAWISFLITSLIFVLASIGNYFKLKFRSDPFMFSDITAIHTALGVSSGYDITLNKRIIFCIFCVVIGTVFLFFLVRGRIPFKGRAAAAVILAVSVFPLWRCVYSSSDIYNNKTQSFEHINRWLATDLFVSKGFVYPFIYSIGSTMDTPPDGYNEQETAQQLAQYSDSSIPESKKVNILAIQLEAFADLTTAGLSEAEDVYADYHALETESLTGSLITNIFAGGTIDTERCFLTGFTDLKDYRANTNSYVWYLRQQGYTVNGSHPCLESFYNRLNVNRYLGFEDYHFTEDYYEKYDYPVTYDDDFFPEMLRLFKEDIASGKSTFSFNVTYQGHGPYITDALNDPDAATLYDGKLSDYGYFVINNYFSSVRNTISNLCWLKAELEQMNEPVVLVVYGDHKPWLGDGSCVYDELGINLDYSTQEGFMNYFSTRYLIWANDAAKEVSGSSFVGEGPTISPCYLMNELFSQLGWAGPAYMKYMNELQTVLPVLNTHDLYFVDGKLVNTIEDSGLAAQKSLSDAMQYYMRRSFLYSDTAAG